MTVANYINDLLYRYDCVIVPNFGGFITNQISSKLDQDSHIFYPPTKQISFNANLKHNDGLLANYMVSLKGISFEQANKAIADTVSSWKKELLSNTVQIASVGTFSLNEAQKIIFEPNTTSNYLTASFGLSAFESTEIKHHTEKVIPLITADKTAQKRIPVFIKYAATAAILLTLGFVGWNGYEKNQQQKDIFAAHQQKIEKKIQEATFVISNPLPTINLNVEKVATKNFHIVAGAFRFPENAEKKIHQLKKKGFDAKILGKNKWGLTQVVFASFENRNDATNNLYKIQKTISKDAWLLVAKKN